MGYRGHDGWQDMSDYVVHFTKAAAGARAVDCHLSIIGSGVLQPGEYGCGVARKVPEVADSQRVVCLSEIPLDMLDRLVERRSPYGLGFSKEFIVKRGGAPVWYLDKNSPQAGVIRDLLNGKRTPGVNPDDPFWQLTPFIDQPGDYPTGKYRFEWEREWRVAGPMRFRPDDVAFLFLPEPDHAHARQFFIDAESENIGPAYHCPFIDASWAMEQIQEALATPSA